MTRYVARPAPLTSCVSLHSVHTAQSESATHFSEAVGSYGVHASVLHRSAAQFSSAVSAPPTYDDSAAPLTPEHVSSRTASSNEITPTYLSDADDPPSSCARRSESQTCRTPGSSGASSGTGFKGESKFCLFIGLKL